MRSGIYLAAVVVILETWLIIRQHNKYIIPQVQGGQTYFESSFRSTSLFWLLLTMSLTMVVYCIYYLSKKKSKKSLAAVLILSTIGLGLCFLLPLESSIINFDSGKIVDITLLIAFYLSIAITQVLVIVASIKMYRGKTVHWLSSVAVISVFASSLLIFGIRVSYKDFFSSTEEKQIICFMTMVIYVACLLVWKPYISVPVLGVAFLGFYFLLEYAGTNARVLPDGDKINYITFFISLAMVSISIYSQRSLEARKDEELELLATQDKLTGLYAFDYFVTLCQKKAMAEKLKEREWVFIATDITSFSLYNEQRGFVKGNEFLKEVGQILKREFPEALVSRQGDDNFVVFAKNEAVEERIEEARLAVEALDEDISPSIKVGSSIFRGADFDMRVSIERARLACRAVKKIVNKTYMFYNDELRERTKLIRHIVSHVDEAIREGHIVAYYQPVARTYDKKICGAEALVRWIDPIYGFMNPGLFISTLEEAQIAYKLDLAMMEIVCKNMAESLQNGHKIVPVSINFSRTDFAVIDVPAEIKKIADKYRVDPKFLHVEITESALLDKNTDLKTLMSQIKANGFEIWLDDFGSGYSSFNALKDYSFDTLKLDMEFLRGFETNEKSRPLIKSVINMARQIGMATLAEGVETQEQAAFLREIGCGKLQGYLISKPIPYEEFVEKFMTKQPGAKLKK